MSSESSEMKSGWKGGMEKCIYNDGGRIYESTKLPTYWMIQYIGTTSCRQDEPSRPPTCRVTGSTERPIGLSGSTETSTCRLTGSTERPIGLTGSTETLTNRLTGSTETSTCRLTGSTERPLCRLARSTGN